MKRAAVLALSALCVSAWALDVPSYKGVSIGASMDEFKAKMPLFECGQAQCTYSYRGCGLVNHATPEQCVDGTSFGGQPIEFAIARFVDGKLGSLSFILPTDLAKRATDAAIERYGKPDKVDDEPFRTRAGTSYPNLRSVWQRGDITMSIALHGARLGQGSAMIYSAAFRQQSEAAGRASTKQGAKDF